MRMASESMSEEVWHWITHVFSNSLFLFVPIYFPAMIVCLWLFYRYPERRRTFSLAVMGLTVWGLLLIPAFTTYGLSRMDTLFEGSSFDYNMWPFPSCMWFVSKWRSLYWLWWFIFPVLALGVSINWKLMKQKDALGVFNIIVIAGVALIISLLSLSSFYMLGAPIG